jgi:hypothetical protein
MLSKSERKTRATEVLEQVNSIEWITNPTNFLEDNASVWLLRVLGKQTLSSLPMSLLEI